MSDGFSGFLFQSAPIFIAAIFIIVISVIAFMAMKGIVTWSRNNAQPEQVKEAKVATKRTDVRGGGETQARSIYYVTFKTGEGDRLEFRVNGRESGQLIEGDQGELRFQGTRYRGFARKKLIHS
ncbi:DUF2500 domain-containing protein [Planococcus lenghuensis]|uniref:DUF2500 domain-containing protein n=1 Tax=Planococcus lenghuensis TaxID=2213202 RepID=A0A1Q2KZG8_9BACL|nr:DUF2500 domain-containing protein [Planococcus lenghuensis]AQQ53032.1 hypothetical protein B0X71_07955 [Planococcus lenghuensis]